MDEAQVLFRALREERHDRIESQSYNLRAILNTLKKTKKFTKATHYALVTYILYDVYTIRRGRPADDSDGKWLDDPFQNFLKLHKVLDDLGRDVLETFPVRMRVVLGGYFLTRGEMFFRHYIYGVSNRINSRKTFGVVRDTLRALFPEVFSQFVAGTAGLYVENVPRTNGKVRELESEYGGAGLHLVMLLLTFLVKNHFVWNQFVTTTVGSLDSDVLYHSVLLENLFTYYATVGKTSDGSGGGSFAPFAVIDEVLCASRGSTDDDSCMVHSYRRVRDSLSGSAAKRLRVSKATLSDVFDVVSSSHLFRLETSRGRVRRVLGLVVRRTKVFNNSLGSIAYLMRTLVVCGEYRRALDVGDKVRGLSDIISADGDALSRDLLFDVSVLEVECLYRLGRYGDAVDAGRAVLDSGSAGQGERAHYASGVERVRRLVYLSGLWSGSVGDFYVPSPVSLSRLGTVEVLHYSLHLLSTGDVRGSLSVARYAIGRPSVRSVGVCRAYFLYLTLLCAAGESDEALRLSGKVPCEDCDGSGLVEVVVLHLRLVFASLRKGGDLRDTSALDNLFKGGSVGVPLRRSVGKDKILSEFRWGFVKFRDHYVSKFGARRSERERRLRGVNIEWSPDGDESGHNKLLWSMFDANELFGEVEGVVSRSHKKAAIDIGSFSLVDLVNGMDDSLVSAPGFDGLVRDYLLLMDVLLKVLVWAEEFDLVDGLLRLLWRESGTLSAENNGVLCLYYKAKVLFKTGQRDKAVKILDVLNGVAARDGGRGCCRREHYLLCKYHFLSGNIAQAESLVEEALASTASTLSEREMLYKYRLLLGQILQEKGGASNVSRSLEMLSSAWSGENRVKMSSLHRVLGDLI